MNPGHGIDDFGMNLIDRPFVSIPRPRFLEDVRQLQLDINQLLSQAVSLGLTDEVTRLQHYQSVVFLFVLFETEPADQQGDCNTKHDWQEQ